MGGTTFPSPATKARGRNEGGTLFVRTDTGDWCNVTRAAAIIVREDRNVPGEWVVLALYSGRAVTLGRGFLSESSAALYVEGLLGDAAA